MWLYNTHKDEVLKLVENLNILYKNWVLWVDGRIAKVARFELEVKYLILLRRGHYLTNLIMKYTHLLCRHMGFVVTMTKIRLSGYRITQARQGIKSALSECYIAKRYNSLVFRYSRLTNRPKHSVNLIKPFQQTGVDYSGHIWTWRERKQQKYTRCTHWHCARYGHYVLCPGSNTFHQHF